MGVDVGRHELLEGFKVNCDLFEFDMILNAKGGRWEGALFGQSRGGEKVLEVTFSATGKKGRTEGQRLFPKNNPRPGVGRNRRQAMT